MSELFEELKKKAMCLYIAVDEVVAKDIYKALAEAEQQYKAEIEQKDKEIARLEGELKSSRKLIKTINKSLKVISDEEPTERGHMRL